MLTKKRKKKIKKPHTSPLLKPKLIIITGTPGVGKTTLAKLLAKKMRYHRLDLHKHYAQISTSYNKQKQCYNINYQKFQKLVQQQLQKQLRGLIIDSHITHLLPKSLVNVCIILTCSDLKLLKQRLTHRKYSKAKIQENLQAELMQICLTQAQQQKHHSITYDTASQSPQQILTSLSKSL